MLDDQSDIGLVVVFVAGVFPPVMIIIAMLKCAPYSDHFAAGID
jgi:hypothetical protein